MVNNCRCFLFVEFGGEGGEREGDIEREIESDEKSRCTSGEGEAGRTKD